VNLTGAGGIALTGAANTNAKTVLDATGQAYSDGGFTLTTGSNALTVTAGSLALSATTAFNSGAAATTFAAASGSSLSAGDVASGGMHLTDADLGRIVANGLTLKTTGAGDDIILGGITVHNGFGALTVSAGRNVLFAGNVNLGANSSTLNAGARSTRAPPSPSRLTRSAAPPQAVRRSTARMS